MKKRVLGRTGLSVSVLGLGGLFLSRHGTNDLEEARRAVRRALELGVNWIDTAPAYSNSEETLGYALKDAPEPYYLSTKLGGRPQPFNPQDKAGLRYSVQESLRLLHRDHIDVLYIHEPDRPGQYDWWTDHDNFHGPVEEVLDELRAEGIVSFVGLGSTTAYELPQIMATGRYDVAISAFNYSLLWREATIAVFPEAKRQQMGIVIGAPFQQGALATRYDEQVYSGARWLSPPRREQYRRLYKLLDEVGISLPELGLRFIISNQDVSMVLVGARSTVEVEANVAAVNKGPLPSELLARLQDIADMVPFRPFEEPFNISFTRPYLGPGVG